MISQTIKKKWLETHISESMIEAMSQHPECLPHRFSNLKIEKLTQQLARLVSDDWSTEASLLSFNQLCVSFLIGFDKLISASISKKVLTTVDYDIIKIAKHIASQQDQRLTDSERQHCLAVMNVAKHWDKYIRNENNIRNQRFVV
ncbi:hypothetical protein [Shewanella maritima]|uniref:hypothetical protein n=1 Tax=Shewanella maritima TaxID=2520507 RepID=UPI003736BFC1